MGAQVIEVIQELIGISKKKHEKGKILFPEYISWMFHYFSLITIIIQNEKRLDKSLILMKSNTSD